MVGGKGVKLPKSAGVKTALSKALMERHSERDFAEKELSLQELAELLFAAQGVTRGGVGVSMRTVPSAGALYPVGLYAVVDTVKGVEAGAYLYSPEKHTIELRKKGTLYEELADACLGQLMIPAAAVNFVYCYAKERIEFKYGERSEQYALIETGASIQSVALMCSALGIGNVVVGAFSDADVAKVLGVSEKPLAVQSVGKL